MEPFTDPTVTIDDIQYVVDDLPQTVQHCLWQIKDIEALAEKAAIETQRYAMMIRGYTATLKEEMDKFKSSIE